MATTYRVLRRNASGSIGEEGTHECNGPEQAIRHIIEKRGGTVTEPTVFIAVPVRNWTEIEVAEEEQKPKLVLKELQPEAAQTTIDDALAEADSPVAA